MGQRSFASGVKRVVPTEPPELKWFVVLIAEAQDGGGADPDAVVDEVMGRWAEAAGRPDGRQLRAEVADAIAGGIEPLAERYWQLMATINGWPPIPATMHRWSWFLAALQERLDR